MAEVHPTLDSRGYLTDPAQISDAILAYFLNTKGLQSNMFFGKLRPLASLIQQYPNNMQALAEAVQGALATQYNAYFDTVNIDVTYNNHAKAFSESEAIYNLSISGQVVYAGKSLQLNEMLENVHAKFSSVLPLSSS